MISIEMAGGFCTRATFGPAPCFELDRQTLRQGPERIVIACHVSRAWKAGRTFFSSFEIHGPLLITFIDQSNWHLRRETRGPFEDVRVAGDCAYGDGRLIAEFSAADALWCARPDSRCWPAVRIQSVVRAALTPPVPRARNATLCDPLTL
jgi:hypothetical protein